jgi:hypothetical protein
MAVKGSKDVENTILPNDLRELPRQEDEPQRRKWYLTQGAFDQFLSLLDLDRDRAGESYETRAHCSTGRLGAIHHIDTPDKRLAGRRIRIDP